MRMLLLATFLTTVLHAEEAVRKPQAVQTPGKLGCYTWIITVRGQEYREVKVTNVTASEITFTHAAGVAKLPLIEMPYMMQELHGFDPHEAAAALPQVKQRRALGIVEAEQSKADMAALLARQKAEHAAINQLEARKIWSRIEVREVVKDGAFCDIWPIVLVEQPGKFDLSGKPVKVPGITQQAPDRVFVAGMTELKVNSVRADWLYPVDVAQRLYAISAQRAYTERKNKSPAR